jgi:TonB-linked SusC/RagA family outer membrane protein
MRTKFSGILTLILAFIVQLTFAQQQTISGTVTDDTGLPLPGVNIVIKGTAIGTQSDFDGNYSLNVNVGQTLVFTYVGFAAQERAVTATTNRVNVQMQMGEELTQVVVTGFAIAREKKALGYAVSEIAAGSIEQRSEGDIARVLSGKSSGVVINNTSGISGSATNINIRGYNSISGSNQPLFIVDGVPISNDTNTVGSFLTGNSGSSRSLDIDPNNIESISVLKGYSAATLYGSEGKNGVILITTKTGTTKDAVKKTEITVIQSVFNNEIASLPNYTKTFGVGFDQSFGNFFSNWGPGFYAEGLGGYLDPSSGIDPDGTYAHPYDRANLADVFPEFQGARLPWRAVPNHVKDFFRSGLALNTSVAIAGSSEDNKLNYSFNYGRLEDEGFTPGNKTSRDNFSLGGRAILSNKFTVSGTFNYSITDFTTPPVAFSSGSSAQDGLSVFGDLFYTPTNLPLMDLPFQNPVTGQSVYYRSDDRIVNPNWIVANSSVNQVTNRFFSSSALNYQINDNLSASYRLGLDNYSENTTIATNRGGGFPASIDLGEYTTYNSTNTIWDHNLMLNGSYSLSDDLGLNFTVGATSKYERFDRFGMRSEDQIVFGVFRHFNFRSQSRLNFNGNNIESTFYRNIVGVYAQADFDFKNYLYLNLAARNDWVSSQLENSKLYPSASVSFLPSVALPGIRSTNGINYLKLRASYGTSAGFASGFPVANNLLLNPSAFIDASGVTYITNTTSSALGNPNLRPELYEEIEVGFESRFLDNRISLDFSYYDRTTKDLITQRPLPPSTGFGTAQVNIGQLDGYGFEIDLGINPVRNEGSGFNWNINTNYTKYRTTVTSLGDDFEEGASLGISGFTNLGNRAYEGLPFGTIAGVTVARDENGNLLVDSSGNYISETGVNPIGDATPDFIVNASNNMTWRGFNFNFLISYQHGGDIFSNTIGGLLARGITQDTDDRLNTLILPGVKEDGTPNDIQINASQYYFDNIGFGPTELRVYDGSVIRLNEISLGYEFPKRFLDRTPFGSVSFTLAGYNLYYNAINTPKHINFDPNIIGVGVSNGRGLDFLNGPSGKRYGFTVKASF